MNNNDVIIYTDGSSRGNPGPGGYGIVMEDCKTGFSKQYSKGFQKTTNNRMELLAVIDALKKLKKTKLKITVFTDSKYVVDSIEKKWSEEYGDDESELNFGEFRVLYSNENIVVLEMQNKLLTEGQIIIEEIIGSATMLSKTAVYYYIYELENGKTTILENASTLIDNSKRFPFSWLVLPPIVYCLVSNLVLFSSAFINSIKSLMYSCKSGFENSNTAITLTFI